MSSTEVQRILEYKFYRDMDYVLVMWKDGTTSWARVLGLNCKDAICGFVSEALRILRDSERHAAEQSRQEKEARLLDKILMKNLESFQSMEIKQSETTNSNIEDRKPRFTEKTPLHYKPSTSSESADILRHTISGTGDRHPTPLCHYASSTQGSESLVRHYSSHKRPVQGDKHCVSSTAKQHSNKLDQRPYAKKPALEVMKVNSMLIIIDPNTNLTIKFYYRDSLPVVSIDISTASFANFDVLASHLYSIYLSGAGFSFFPSEDPEAAPETIFERYMRSNRLFLVQNHGGCVWILYAPDVQDDLFKITTNSRFFIFKIEDDPFLNNLCSMKSFVGENTAWARGTFKFGVGMLGDFLYKDAVLPCARTIFLFGNLRLMRHLLNFVRNRGEIVDSIESASTVLIQSSYLDFLHQIPGFYESLRKHTRFFLENGSGFEEILISGGMVTFSNEFIEESELLAVADLIGTLSRRKNWEIKIKKSTYVILKRRLAAQQYPPEYLSKIKNIYRVFKNSVLEGFEGSLRDYLESKYFKTHRLFLEVSLLKVADGTVTIDEALRLVMST